MSLAPRPSDYAGWASGPSGYITTPLAGTRAIGWQPSGIANSAYFNWMQNLNYQWQLYTDSVGTGIIGGAIGVKSITLDAVGGASGVSGIDGAVKVVASFGSTGPTGPAIPRGVLGIESGLFAAASCNGQTLVSSYNIASASHVATGTWALLMAVKPLSDNRVIGAGGTAGGYVEVAPNSAVASGLGQVLVGSVVGGFLQNVAWTVQIFHI